MKNDTVMIWDKVFINSTPNMILFILNDQIKNVARNKLCQIFDNLPILHPNWRLISYFEPSFLNFWRKNS